MSAKLAKPVYSKQGTRIFAIIFGMIAILGFMSILSPTSDIPKPETGQPITSQGTYSGYLFRVVIITLTMVVVLIVGLRIYKKQLKLSGKNNLSLNILGKHYINDKQYLLKVLIEDKYLLLGISESNINYICALDGPEDDEAEQQTQFSTILDLESEKSHKS